jgi:hypothetical protein
MSVNGRVFVFGRRCRLWSKAATRLDGKKYSHTSCAATMRATISNIILAAKGDSHDNSAKAYLRHQLH